MWKPSRPPRLGHALLALDPGALAGREAFLDRIETLVEAMLGDDGVRLPGSRRDALRAAAERDGLNIPAPLLEQLHVLAGR
jgi:(2R)-3-sulfolactate dehydrogenase (NADP+)